MACTAVCLWPRLGIVQDAQDFYGIVNHTIDNDERQRWNIEFAGIGSAPASATIGHVFQRVGTTVNSFRC
jgi:hypothetical protein